MGMFSMTFMEWGPLEIHDIENRGCLDAVIEQHRPEAVIHFAAYACVGESVQDPGVTGVKWQVR